MGYVRKITPAQFLQQIRTLGSSFDVNMFNAKQDITRYAVEHFKKSFDRLGFVGDGGKKWRKRKRNYAHPILHKTGLLKASVMSPRSTKNDILIVATSPYAKYHNDEDGSWSPNVQRQFIGDSPVLDNWIKRRLHRALKDTFRTR